MGGQWQGLPPGGQGLQSRGQGHPLLGKIPGLREHSDKLFVINEQESRGMMDMTVHMLQSWYLPIKHIGQCYHRAAFYGWLRFYHSLYIACQPDDILYFISVYSASAGWFFIFFSIYNASAGRYITFSGYFSCVYSTSPEDSIYYLSGSATNSAKIMV